MPKWLRAMLEGLDELFGVDLVSLAEPFWGESEDHKPIWSVATEEAAQFKLKRWEAELLARKLHRQGYDPVLLSKNLGDGKTVIVKTYRKDASMGKKSQESPQVRKLRQELAERDRQIEKLRSAGLPVDVPPGVRKLHIVVEDSDIAAMSHGASKITVTDQDANELLLGEWHEMPSRPDVARARHLVIPVTPAGPPVVDASNKDDMKQLPIHANFRADEPLGWVRLPAHLADEAALGGMVLAPGGKANEHGKIVEVMEFGLIPSETFDTRPDSLPVRVDGGGVVGGVRISKSMTFQYGRFEDLELAPIVQDETDTVVGYRVLNRTLRAPAAFVDRNPGPYILFLHDDGSISGLEAIPAKHVLELRQGSYSLQHPYECRANGKSLHDCEMWKRVQDNKDDLLRLGEHQAIPGRYFITYNEETGKLELENVEFAGAGAAAEPVAEKPREEPQLPPMDISEALWGVKMNEDTRHPGEIRPAPSRGVAELACTGVGVLVHRETVDSEWKEVSPDA